MAEPVPMGGVPYHPPRIIGGATYAFVHLEPFTMSVDSQRAGKALRVHVRFATHCFTKAYDQATHPFGDPIIYDEGNRPRTFCTTRYRLSLRVPSLIRSLNHPKAAVQQTAEERNWLHSVTVDEPGGRYHVFFELRPAAVRSRHLQDLSLMVESAYAQNPEKAGPAVRGSMKFILLCGKIYKGEPSSARR